MEIMLFVGILVVLAIIGAALEPVMKKRESTRIAELQRNLPRGRVVCPVCTGRRRIWDPTSGNPNPYTGASAGRSVTCYRCAGLGSVQRLYG